MSTAIQQLESQTGKPQKLVAEALELLHPRVALACSFSLEDIVIAHMMTAAREDARIFAIDTGRLHEETYQCADALERKLGIKIEWYFPRHEAVEDLVRSKGMFSFYESLENRHECCFIRKVEPLTRALSALDGWITGMRQEHNVTRSDLRAVQKDDAHDGIVKLNPLADWSQVDVDAYIKEHGLPRNRLIRQGYQSIGCAPCTRPVADGADPRSGRWWWEDPENKECGLHTQKVSVNEGAEKWTI